MKRAIFFEKIGSSGIRKSMLHFIIAFLFLVIAGGISGDTVFAQSNTQSTISDVQIADGAEWYFLAGSTTPPQKWYHYDFDMSGWRRGPTGIGYGLGSNRTYLADMQGNYSTLYARKEFTIDNRQPVLSMKLSVACDGPFIAYLNGVEVIRTNTVQTFDPVTDMPPAEQYDLMGFSHELIPDKNILAVKCENDDINSNDFSFIPVFEVLKKWGEQ